DGEAGLLRILLRGDPTPDIARAIHKCNALSLQASQKLHAGAIDQREVLEIHLHSAWLLGGDQLTQSHRVIGIEFAAEYENDRPRLRQTLNPVCQSPLPAPTTGQGSVRS